MHDLDDLIDRIGVGEIFGVSNKAVKNWVDRYADFPAPLVVYGNGVAVYSWDMVRQWYIDRFGMKKFRLATHGRELAR